MSAVQSENTPLESHAELQNGFSDNEFDSELEFDSDELASYEGDWAESAQDFTKKYNKLRNSIQNHKTLRSSAAPLDSAQTSKKLPSFQASVPSENTADHHNLGHLSGYHGNHYDIKSQLTAKFANRINLDTYAKPIVPSNYASTRVGNKKSFGANKGQVTDRANRATTEQVLDPRTRMILFKILNQGIVYEINGSINTGKEANVYHALTGDGLHRAIKVYKTSILIFKDRDRYFTGEYRFRSGYSRHNPRKMVKLWAEKEMRNLKRIHQAGIPCPEPLTLRQHVLVMEFLGDSQGWPYPRLKDATIKPSRFPKLYFQIITYMRLMYHVCKLVHADLSEYNLLYNKSKLFVIDVSQSVEHDHPYALDFLRSDCSNINDFFRRNGVLTIGLRKLFDFITDPFIGKTPAEFEPDLSKVYLEAQEMDPLEKPKQEHDDLVFKQSFIPRNLNEVLEYERDVDKLAKGNTQDMLYIKMTGLDLSSEQEQNTLAPKQESNTPSLQDSEKAVPNTNKNNASAVPSVNDPSVRESKKVHFEDQNLSVNNDKTDDCSLGNQSSSTSATQNENTDPSIATELHFDKVDAAEATVLDSSPDKLSMENIQKGDESALKHLELDEQRVKSTDQRDGSDKKGETSNNKGSQKGKKFADKEKKREHKKLVKLEKREKRKTKIPKAVKKRKEQTSGGNRISKSPLSLPNFFSISLLIIKNVLLKDLYFGLILESIKPQQIRPKLFSKNLSKSLLFGNAHLYITFDDLSHNSGIVMFQTDNDFEKVLKDVTGILRNMRCVTLDLSLKLYNLKLLETVLTLIKKLNITYRQTLFEMAGLW
ncbi:hypothetical protein BB560_002851 [Smittium megazygosporum]|uniref:Serine/threonine-protein kinase RIO1 n=1 Tax=Smittium megazygosporum TaxID=133381 RepID=A0A2T9ZDK8_9FUNG|nr:hypothetical protein BB560_002851 [Smittium megazygosporum]